MADIYIKTSNGATIFFINLCPTTHKSMINKFEWKENYIAENTILEYVSLMVSKVIPSRTTTEEISAIVISPNGANPKIQLSQRYVPLPSESVLLFADRYNQKAFPKALNHKEYLQNDDIQNLISHLDIDKEKFWFAILFAYDYSCQLCLIGKRKKESACEQIHKLADKISENIKATDEYYGTELKAPLTLTLSNGKKREDITIDSEPAIGYILAALQEQMKKEPLESHYAYTHHKTTDETKDTGISVHIAYFAKLLMTIFDQLPQVRARRKKGAKHSRKETDLICKLIYFTGISRKKSWLQPENDNLKAYLRQYTHDTDTFSSIYPTFDT